MQLAEFLHRLKGVKGSGGQYTALCPAHNDHNRSLSVSVSDDGKILVKCFAQCTTADIVRAMGLDVKDLFSNKPEQFEAKRWDYLGDDGNVLFTKVRKPGKDKQFHIEPKRATAQLYNKPIICHNSKVYVVEGEKDVETLRTYRPATTAPYGAGSAWLPQYVKDLTGKDVVIIPDNDEPGRAYAQNCAKAIAGKAHSVKIVDLVKAYPQLPDKGDISDLVKLVGMDEALAILDKLEADTGEWVDNFGDANSKAELETFTAAELKNMALGDIPFIVNDFLHQGLAILVADPKIGKSFMMIDLCLSVAHGRPFLGFETKQSGVAYLALEDSKRRLQSRIRMRLGDAAWPNNFHLAIVAPTIDNGLADHIRALIKKHSNIKLVVVDVLQRVRSLSAPRGKNAYEVDSADLAKLKAIADEHDMNLTVVHHNRKGKDPTDAFQNVSGSMGIVGAVDQAFSIVKETRESADATLKMISRELGDEEWKLTKRRGSPWWEMLGTSDEEQAKAKRASYEDSPVVKTIRELLRRSPLGIEMSSTDFFESMGRIAGEYGGFTPSTLGKEFYRLAPELLKNDSILHSRGRSNKKRNHSFSRSMLSLPSQASLPSQVSLLSQAGKVTPRSDYVETAVTPQTPCSAVDSGDVVTGDTSDTAPADQAKY